eukprot:TRINITY_DN18232_c0_g1_i1.p2 TRINITY_DN18232_c0_g1~~TRINITY_DN18232_c0_g1_i1.p2  ORF type:complete len:243 (-),score=56.06 TRINITY_DN18232_c0_g1_i1:23-751(-)
MQECPVCKLTFPLDEIEAHAAQCEPVPHDDHDAAAASAASAGADDAGVQHKHKKLHQCADKFDECCPNPMIDFGCPGCFCADSCACPVCCCPYVAFCGEMQDDRFLESGPAKCFATITCGRAYCCCCREKADTRPRCVLPCPLSCLLLPFCCLFVGPFTLLFNCFECQGPRDWDQDDWCVGCTEIAQQLLDYVVADEHGGKGALRGNPPSTGRVDFSPTLPPAGLPVGPCMQHSAAHVWAKP